jgi:hypothetical protein
MHTLNHTDLAATIDGVVFDLNMPLMVWGQPGVGKSDVARQAAAKRGALLVDIRLSQYDSVDLRGIPSPENGKTVWNLPSTIPFVGNDAFPDDVPILLFFDEINSAAPSTMAVAYQIVLDRACGEHILKDNVFIVAAGNRDGDKGVTGKMPLPLANRFCHVELGVSAEATIDYMLETGAPAEGIAFLSWRKQLVSTFDPSKPEKAFATGRSWFSAFKAFQSDLPQAVKRTAISGCIGEGPALEFFAFCDMMDKVIPVSKIIADPEGCALPDELSMCYATAVSISGEMTLENAAPLHTYLQRMDPEFLVLSWQMALKRDDELLQAPEFLQLAKKYKALFKR